MVGVATGATTPGVPMNTRAENVYEFRRVNMHGTKTGPHADPDYRVPSIRHYRMSGKVAGSMFM